MINLGIWGKSVGVPAVTPTYRALLVAVGDAEMNAFYQKLLAKGKPKKVALAAVMRKLLVLAYGVLKSEKPFDVDYQN